VPWIQFGLLLVVLVLGVWRLFAIARDVSVIRRELFNAPEDNEDHSDIGGTSDRTDFVRPHPR